MMEHPIFVPFRDDHLAAVVAVPDSPVRSLVVLLQGLGSPRAHRYSLWTRTARRLADRGIASVRMDYPELGDSTGLFPNFLNDPPVEEVAAVTQVVLDALGLETFGVAGNCLGTRSALALADRMEACVSVECILPNTPKDLLRGEGRRAPHRAAGVIAKKTPRLARIVRRHVHSERIEPRFRFIPDVRRALRSTRVLFLYLGKEEVGRRLERGVADLAERDPNIEPGRAIVRVIPATGLWGMRLPLELQPLVIDSVVEWMDGTLPGGSPAIESLAPAQPSR